MVSRKQSFGSELRRLREEAKGEPRMSDLAEAIDVSVVYISDIERDRRNPPSPEKIFKMLEAIGKEDQIDWMLQLAAKSRRSVEISVENKSDRAIFALASLARRVEEGQVSDDQLESILKTLKKDK